MLPFFRKIRWQLARDNQFFKYGRYAIGEIVLVVIGILIALQINQWNDYRMKRNLEVEYLNEIKDNLQKDLVHIEKVLKFNQEKETTIQNTLGSFEKAKASTFDLNSFGKLMSILGTNDHFTPNRTAFDNLLDTESVNLIINKELRTLLSAYYKFDFEGGTQETIGYRTRNFSERAASHLTTKENMNQMYGVNLDLKSSADTQIQKDENLITSMVFMSITMSYQNQLLTKTQNDINLLLELIETYATEKK